MSLESTWPQKLELATWAAGQALFICVELKPYTEGERIWAPLQRPPEPVRADLSGDWDWAPGRDRPTFRLE